jgi:hypothetical protein
MIPLAELEAILMSPDSRPVLSLLSGLGMSLTRKYVTKVHHPAEQKMRGPHCFKLKQNTLLPVNLGSLLRDRTTHRRNHKYQRQADRSQYREDRSYEAYRSANRRRNDHLPDSSSYGSLFSAIMR